MGGPARLLLSNNCSKRLDTVLATILQELERIEEKFSFYKDSSLLSMINSTAGTGRSVAIDDEFSGLLHYADTLFRESNGAFDPTAGVLKDIWNFQQASLPNKKELSKVLKYVDWGKFKWSCGHASLPVRGMRIDLGGIIKEYAVDFAAKIIRDFKINSALVELAGDICVIGNKPNGFPWEISIRHPRKANQSAILLKLTDISIATSGDYERSFILNGKRYSHLLNPITGYPIGGLISTSVLSKQCLIAGGTATTALLKEDRQGLEWLEKIGLPYLAIDSTLKMCGNMNTSLYSCSQEVFD